MEQKENKVGIKGWIALFVLCVMFSGVLKNAEGPLAAFDFSNLVGAWGKIGDAGQNFIGKGGAGAREGMMQALSLIPAISFAVAIIDVVTQLGAIDAGVNLFTPLLRPLLGLPGDCGVAFVSTFTSSDVGSVMTRDLYNEGKLTEKERAIFTAYQYAGSAVVLNTMNTQAALLPIILFAAGPVIVVLFFCKVLGANLVRLILTLEEKKKKEA